jgi:hypothetical protein
MKEFRFNNQDRNLFVDIAVVHTKLVEDIMYYYLAGELSNMCHPSCTINKVNNNDYCTSKGVPGTMAHIHIKE